MEEGDGIPDVNDDDELGHIQAEQQGYQPDPLQDDLQQAPPAIPSGNSLHDVMYRRFLSAFSGHADDFQATLRDPTPPFPVPNEPVPDQG